MIKQYDLLVKLILIGGSGVGKSSLLMQFSQNKFNQNYLTTIGVDFRFKSIKQDGKNIKFQIWDTAGQERFRTITSAYYKGADGILMVYDLTQPSSVDDLQNFWINQAYNYCDKNIKVLLIGNKSDCERSINPQRIKKIVEKYNYTSGQVSAKTGNNVYDLIKDFGMGIAKSKMQKLGMSWHSFSTNSSASLTKTSSSKQQDKQKELTQKAQKNEQQNNQQSLQLKVGGGSGRKNPSYQKKCC